MPKKIGKSSTLVFEKDSVTKTPEFSRDFIREVKGINVLKKAFPKDFPVVKIEGKSLIIERGDRLEDILKELDAKQTVLELAKLLDKLHSKGITHGDPGRSNIIRRRKTGKFSLIDFETVKEGATKEDIFSEERAFLEEMILVFPKLKSELKATLALITNLKPVQVTFLGKKRTRVRRSRRGKDSVYKTLKSVFRPSKKKEIRSKRSSKNKKRSSKSKKEVRKEVRKCLTKKCFAFK